MKKILRKKYRSKAKPSWRSRNKSREMNDNSDRHRNGGKQTKA